MLKKIKELSEINEVIKEMSNNFSYQAQMVVKFSENLNTMKSDMDSLKQSQNSLTHQLSKDSQDLSELRTELKKEITDFKLVKSRLEKSLLEKFEEEIKEELVPKFNKFENYVKDFTNLADASRLITSRIDNTKSQMDKLIAISNDIKEKDFDLVQFATKLSAVEKEKQELIRKIDSMEALVAKSRMRR